MDNNFNQPRHDSAPATPRPPMQYFTSGSSHSASPRFSSSTPNYQYRTPRMQHPHHRSPYRDSMSAASPYDSSYVNSYANRSAHSPQYTPSPVRPRHYQNSPRGSSSNSYGSRNYNSSPGSFHGRGGGSHRGRGMVRGQGMSRDGEKITIDRYYKEEMVRDPWQGLKPYLMKDGSRT